MQTVSHNRNHGSASYLQKEQYAHSKKRLIQISSPNYGQNSNTPGKTGKLSVGTVRTFVEDHVRTHIGIEQDIKVGTHLESEVNKT